MEKLLKAENVQILSSAVDWKDAIRKATVNPSRKNGHKKAKKKQVNT